jgi:hypothetical protein
MNAPPDLVPPDTSRFHQQGRCVPVGSSRLHKA